MANVTSFHHPGCCSPSFPESETHQASSLPVQKVCNRLTKGLIVKIKIKGREVISSAHSNRNVCVSAPNLKASTGRDASQEQNRDLASVSQLLPTRRVCSFCIMHIVNIAQHCLSCYDCDEAPLMPQSASSSQICKYNIEQMLTDES